MTLTLTPEIEQAIDEAARRQERTPEQVATATLEAGLLTHTLGGPQPIRNTPTTEAERQARVRAGKGSLAHLGSSRLMQDKAAEKAREERHWRQTAEETA